MLAKASRSAGDLDLRYVSNVFMESDSKPTGNRKAIPLETLTENNFIVHNFGMDIFTIRRKKLRQIIQMNFEDNQSLFARAVDRSESYINRLLSDPMESNSSKNLGEQLARQFEERLNLPEHWFDREDSTLPDWNARTEKRVSFISNLEPNMVKPLPPMQSTPVNKTLHSELLSISADLAMLSVRLNRLINSHPD